MKGVQIAVVKVAVDERCLLVNAEGKDVLSLLTLDLDESSEDAPMNLTWLITSLFFPRSIWISLV